jgi:Rrf2 family nitric oxide-sensitive transcriptional repressor
MPVIFFTIWLAAARREWYRFNITRFGTMNLSYYTDYSLRTIIFLGLHPSAVSSISQISEAFGISRNHLVKVVNHLARWGFIKSTRGRGGGLRLARDPAEINLGELVRRTETNFRLVECFDPSYNTCPLTAACELKTVMAEARNAFLKTLDRHSLADVLRRRKAMLALLDTSAGKAKSPVLPRKLARHSGEILSQ